MKTDFAARALALVGTRFRAQGRGVGGVDCVGLALNVYGIPATYVSGDYELRGQHEERALTFLETRFRRIGPSAVRAGDLLLMRVADDQLHIGVRTSQGFVHAHAGLRRVVETPGKPQWPLIGAFRMRSR
jgi:hypothetical protein